MSKFLFSVSNLIKRKCRDDILLGDMDTSRLMSHGPQAKGDKLWKCLRTSKTLRQEIMNTLNSDRAVEILHNFRESLQPKQFNNIALCLRV